MDTLYGFNATLQYNYLIEYSLGVCPVYSNALMCNNAPESVLDPFSMRDIGKAFIEISAIRINGSIYILKYIF